MTASSETELLQQQFAAFIDRLRPETPWALAVSGGSDSVALMLLAQTVHKGSTPHHVVTVDHGIRPEAKKEAERVKQWADKYGLPHSTLVSTDSALAEKPVQARARAVRYQLLADYCRDHNIPTLLTGHTQDDQAETILMRMSQGSGLDGLAGMKESGALPSQPSV